MERMNFAQELACVELTSLELDPGDLPVEAVLLVKVAYAKSAPQWTFRWSNGLSLAEVHGALSLMRDLVMQDATAMYYEEVEDGE